MREDSGTSSEFDAITYVVEVLLKYETTVCLGLLWQTDQVEAENLGFQIVSSDGLGTWADALPKAINAITISALHDYLAYTRAFQQKFGAKSKYEQRVLDAARSAWSDLEEADFTFSKNRLGLLQFFVAVRNRTRGHGATTQSQYEAINASLVEVLAYLLGSSPILREDLIRPMKLKAEGQYACRLLRGFPTQEQILVPSSVIIRSDLLYYRGPNGFLAVPDFINYIREDDTCFFLNGKRRRSDDQSEFLDYITNSKKSLAVSFFQDPPSDRPNSLTAGQASFDWDDSIVNNLPKADFTTYVPRLKLETELRDYLTGSAVNFVSLEGQGGAGKTTLALRIARQIVNSSTSSSSSFDFIIWFSARDVDLDERAGPLRRRRQVTSLASCATFFCELLDIETVNILSSEVEFERVLASGAYKFLLIFDNFESFDDTAVLQQFIKRNLAHPSKALMTSREDAFHGDVPVDVGGLTDAEASDLIRKAARQSGCEPRITEPVIKKIVEASLGNPYAIKLIVNEFSRTDSIEAVLPRALNDDYLSALFRRSFERLEDGPAYLFLLIGLSSLARSESFSQLCCVGRKIDFTSAKRSILENHLFDAPDNDSEGITYRISWAAQEFCRKIVIGHRMQREVEQDVELLLKLSTEGLRKATKATLFSFFNSSADVESTDVRLSERNRNIALWLRSNDPFSAKQFAMANAGDSSDREGVRDAFKRAVELNSTDVDLWLSWADFEARHKDVHRALDLTLRAIDFTDEQESLLRAGRLMLRIMSDLEFKETTSFSRRGQYTRSLISRFEKIRAELGSSSFAVLGWLYLQTNEKRNAKRAAEEGLAKTPAHNECASLLSRLEDRRGWR